MLRSIGAAVVLAGSAILLAALPAAAGTAAASSGEEAGYQASGNGWHFRYVQAQVTLPDVTGAADTAAFPGYGVSVRLTNGTESAVLGISDSTGGSSSSYSPAFNLELKAGGSAAGCGLHGGAGIPAGDTVLFSLYFSGTHLSASVTDKTDPARDFSFSCLDPVAHDMFTQAQTGTEFGITPWDVSPPQMVNGHFRLAAFTNTVVTSRTGIRGSAGSAPWPVQRLRLTATGGSASQVRASVPFAWGTYAAAPDSKVRAGRNFSVWLPSDPN